MLLRLFLLFTIIPLVELALLIELGRLTGVGVTIGVVLLTGLIGAALARREGWKTWTQLHHNLAKGISPADQLIDGLLILIAGALLVTPGLLTDLAGFSLLLPAARKRLRRRLSAWFEKRTMVSTGAPTRRQVVDYQILDKPEE